MAQSIVPSNPFEQILSRGARAPGAPSPLINITGRVGYEERQDAALGRAMELLQMRMRNGMKPTDALADMLMSDDYSRLGGVVNPEILAKAMQSAVQAATGGPRQLVGPGQALVGETSGNLVYGQPTTEVQTFQGMAGEANLPEGDPRRQQVAGDLLKLPVDALGVERDKLSVRRDELAAQREGSLKDQAVKRMVSSGRITQEQADDLVTNRADMFQITDPFTQQSYAILRDKATGAVTRIGSAADLTQPAGTPGQPGQTPAAQPPAAGAQGQSRDLFGKIRQGDTTGFGASVNEFYTEVAPQFGLPATVNVDVPGLGNVRIGQQGDEGATRREQNLFAESLSQVLAGALGDKTRADAETQRILKSLKIQPGVLQSPQTQEDAFVAAARFVQSELDAAEALLNNPQAPAEVKRDSFIKAAGLRKALFDMNVPEDRLRAAGPGETPTARSLEESLRGATDRIRAGASQGQAPTALPPRDQLKAGESYTLPDGRKGVWNGSGFEVQ